MKIVVIGGTDLIGSKTVAILRQRGHEVVAAAPNTGTMSGSPSSETTGRPTIQEPDPASAKLKKRAP